MGAPFAQVASKFAEMFYKVADNQPEEMHKFYKEESHFTVFWEGWSSHPGPVTRDVGPSAIGERWKSISRHKDAMSSIDFIAQPGPQIGESFSILVHVLGTLAHQGVRRTFLQTFLLAPQAGGYYVHNDLLRVLWSSSPDVSTTPIPYHYPPARYAQPYLPQPVDAQPVMPTADHSQAPPAHQQHHPQQAAPEPSRAPATVQPYTPVQSQQTPSAPQEGPERPKSENENEQAAREPPLHGTSSAQAQTQMQASEASQAQPQAQVPVNQSHQGQASAESQPRQSPPQQQQEKTYASMARKDAGPVKATEPAPVSATGPAAAAQAQVQQSKAESGEAEGEEEEERQGQGVSKTSVCVKQIDTNASEAELRQVLEPFGTVRSMQLRPQRSGADQFAFVEFEEASAASSACERQVTLRGRTLRIEPKWKSPPQRGSGRSTSGRHSGRPPRPASGNRTQWVQSSAGGRSSSASGRTQWVQSAGGWSAGGRSSAPKKAPAS